VGSAMTMPHAHMSERMTQTEQLPKFCIRIAIRTIHLDPARRGP
jgi:hypothetical protein